jgi:hypothetical protein
VTTPASTKPDALPDTLPDAPHHDALPKDAVLVGAVDVARAAAEETAAPTPVGDHLGVDVEGERLVTHRFACLDPAYQGWHWAVTVTRVPRGRTVTVCDSVLLPGPEAVLPKPWVPWSQRLAPGDLGVGDLLPTDADDDRLEPGYAATGDADADEVALWELGLGRPRVLSPLGRDEAVDRWYSGDSGPTAPVAEAAPAQCATCGFVTPLAGSLRQVFGVCTNAFSPSDARVVSYDHGCGAHSEIAVLPGPVDVTPALVDELGYDMVDTADLVGSDAPDELADTVDSEAPGDTVDSEAPGDTEELGQS